MRLLMAGIGLTASIATAQTSKPGVMLGELTWREAEPTLTSSSVVVIPLGSAAQQHGPHLKLDASDRLARYLAQRVRAAADVIIAPSLVYHFHSTSFEYPGSISLSQNTARDMTLDVIRNLARYGPRRFYVLNTGVTTMVPLKAAADVLADEGILLGYTDVRYRVNNSGAPRQQAPVRGTPNADEVETSMMLFVDPTSVDMSKAVREYGQGTGPLTRKRDGPGVFSESGVAGDPTLATRDKGQRYVEAVLAGALQDIDQIRAAALPVARTTAAAPPPPPAPRRSPAQNPEQRQPNGCTAADERSIRAVGERFSYLWRQMDSEKIAELFAETGDMRHPDGTIERGPNVIRDNRRELFSKREYRGSNHPVSLNDIRCVGPNVAIADGKWELRLEGAPTTGAPARNLPAGSRHSGWCTLVLTGGGSAPWSIQAWRYTVNPPDGTQAPTTLKQPGFLGRGGH